MSATEVVEFRFRLGRRDVRSVEELREQAAEHKQRMQEFAALLQSAFDTGVRAIEVTDRTRRHALLIQQQRDGILRVGRFDDRGAVGHIEVDPGRYEELGREIFSMLSADPDDRSHLTVRLLPPSRSLVEFWLQQPLGKWGMDLASVVHESNQLRARGDYEGAHRVEAEALARMGPAPAPTPIPDTVGTAPGAVSLSALVGGLPDGVVPVGPALVRVYRVGPLHKDKRGLFFAGSPESAGAYSSLHSGHQVQSYVVTAQNAVKASGPHQLWRHFFGKPLNLAEIDVRRKFNDIRKALRWADERLAAKVRAAGYDALIYTSPPPPAEMELAVVAPTARVVPDATPTVGGSVDLESRLKDLRLAFWKGDAAAAATALRLVDELAASGDPAAQVVRLRAIAGFSTPGRGLPWQAAGLPAIDVQAELATVLDSIPRTRAAWETLVRAIVPADLADVVIKRKNVAQLRAFVEHEVTDAGHRARIEAWGAGLREETTSGHAEGRRVIAGCSSYPYPPVDVDSLETMGWVLRDYHRRWLAENLGCVLLVPVADLVPAPGEPFYEPDSRYIRSYVAHWDSPGHRHYVPDGFWREDGRVEVTDGRHRISAHRARGGMEVPIFVGHDSRFLRAGTTAGASRPWTTRQYAEQVLHLNVGRRLGEGGFGEVYALPGGKVIKFTHSDAERACATWVKKHKRPSPHLPRVYRSGEIPEYTVRWVGSEPRINDQHGTGPRFWYIREEVPDTYAATVPGESRAAKVALLTPELHEAISADIQRAAWRLWHDHRLWLMPDFALLRQWGRRADGTIVLRDLACGTPEEGVNPETQEGGRLPETEPPPWYPETAGGAPTEYEVLKHQLTRPRATRFPARVECRPEPERIQKWLDFYPLGPMRTLERMRALQGRRGIWIGIDTILNLLGEHFPSMADADTNVPEHVQQLASGVPLAGPADLRLLIPPGSGEDEAPGFPAPFAELALVEEIVDRSLALPGSRRAWRSLRQFRHAAARMIWRALRSLANRAGTLNVDEGFAHYAACWEQRMEDRLRFQIPAGRGDVVAGAVEYQALKEQLARPRTMRFPARIECRPEPERVEKWRGLIPLGSDRSVARLLVLRSRRAIWIALDVALQMLRELLQPEMGWIGTNVPDYVRSLAFDEPVPGSAEEVYIDMPDPRAGQLIDQPLRRELHSLLSWAADLVAAPDQATMSLSKLRQRAVPIIWFTFRAFGQTEEAWEETLARYAACWEQRVEDRLRFLVPAGRGDVISGPVEASPRNPYPPGSSENLLFSEMVEMAAKYPDEANAAAMAAFALRQSEPRYAAWPEVVSNLVTQGLLRTSYATEISPENFDGRFTIPGCPVVWDSRNGLGATGNNADIRWFGFVALMRPETFLRLALPLATPRERSTSGLERYRILPGWGPPMLYIDVSNRQMIRVVGHEGRHRATVFARLCPDALMPVAFMPRYKRAKDMTPDVLQDIRVRMISEGGGFVFGPLFDEVFVGDVALHLWDDTTVGSATVGGRLWYPGINWASDAIVLRERAGVLEVLLGLQNPKQTGGRRQWALLGGFRDKAESAEQAARREAREEGGINLQRHHLIGKTRVYGGKGTRYDPRDEADRWIQTQGFVYLVAPSMEPRCVQDPDGGIIDARFVPVEMALRRRLRASHNQLLADAVELWRRQRPM